MATTTTKPNAAMVRGDGPSGPVVTPTGMPLNGYFFRDPTSSTGYSYVKGSKVVQHVHVNRHNQIHTAPAWYHPKAVTKPKVTVPAAAAPPAAPGGGAPAPSSGYSPAVQSAITTAVNPLTLQIGQTNAQSAADIAQAQQIAGQVQTHLQGLAAAGDHSTGEMAAMAAQAVKGNDATAVTQGDYLNRLLNGTVAAGGQGAAGVQSAVDVSHGDTEQNAAIGALTWGHENAANHDFLSGLQGIAGTRAQEYQADRTNRAAQDVQGLQLQIAQAIAGAPAMQRGIDVEDRTFNEGVRQFNEQQALAKQTAKDAFANNVADRTASVTNATTRAQAQVLSAQARAAGTAAAAKARAAGATAKQQATAAAKATKAAADKEKARRKALVTQSTAIDKRANTILDRLTKPQHGIPDYKIVNGKKTQVGWLQQPSGGGSRPGTWKLMFTTLVTNGMTREAAAAYASRQFPDAKQSDRDITSPDGSAYWRYNPATGKFVVIKLPTSNTVAQPPGQAGNAGGAHA